jgi:23S rRNA pseudouridine1911/1915/1917 synthase
VLGDPLYGGTEKRIEGSHPAHRADLREAIRTIGRQALHAWELRLVHPVSGEEMRFQSPVPNEFREAWSRLRLADETG